MSVEGEGRGEWRGGERGHPGKNPVIATEVSLFPEGEGGGGWGCQGRGDSVTLL